MKFFADNLRQFAFWSALFFTAQVILLYYFAFKEYSSLIPDMYGLLARVVLMSLVYGLLFYQVYRARKNRSALRIFIQILVLGVSVTAFVAMPVLLAKSLGILTEKVSYLYIFEINILFGLFLAMVVYYTRYISVAFSKVAFLVLMNTVFVVNSIVIAVMYYTGFEPGPTVLLHLSWDAVKVGALDYIAVVLLMLVVMVPVNKYLLGVIKSHKDSTVNYAVVSLISISVMLNLVILNFDLYKTKAIAPLYSVVDLAANSMSSAMLKGLVLYSELEVSPDEKIKLVELGIDLDAMKKTGDIEYPEKFKNVITIYLESFQLNFTRHGREMYSELTPNLNALSDEYVVFPNFINSVTPTINAMISSQCGVNFLLNSSNMIEAHHGDDELNESQILKQDVKNMWRSIKALPEDKLASQLLSKKPVCISDVLANAGYYQVLMKGAPINFSGKGVFFSHHGYDETIGLKELNADGKYNELNTWGLNDPDLFDEALAQLQTLEAKQPFNLTMLTLNSHIPGYESSDCPVYRKNNTLLNGIHCTDYALGDFLRRLQQLEIYKNTVVVLVGDHMLFNSQQVRDLLDGQALSWFGRTYLSIRSPDLQHTDKLKAKRKVFGVTPDLAPTILELLNVQNSSFISGKSLLSERENYQRITTNNFDIVNGKMVPEQVLSYTNRCSFKELVKSNIAYESDQAAGAFDECQRSKIHHLQQKSIYQ